MNRNPTGLETAYAVYFSRIIEHQEEIMKMLAEVQATNSNETVDEIFNKHLSASRGRVAHSVQEFYGML